MTDAPSRLCRCAVRLERDLCEQLTCEHAPGLYRMKRLRHAVGAFLTSSALLRGVGNVFTIRPASLALCAGHIAYWFLMGLLLIFLVFYYGASSISAGRIIARSCASFQWRQEELA